MTADRTADASDGANGWEAIAAEFMAVRSCMGADTVRVWASRLPKGAAVLDVGCGFGKPIAEVLIAQRCTLYALDAAPSMVAAFRQRFPNVPVACEAAESSRCFDRRFDGIVAVGLIFLLKPQAQRALIQRVAAALLPSGRFLFTAPVQAAAWNDALTGRTSVSLGDEVYRRLLFEAELRVDTEYVDEGGNHYYDTVRR